MRRIAPSLDLAELCLRKAEPVADQLLRKWLRAVRRMMSIRLDEMAYVAITAGAQNRLMIPEIIRHAGWKQELRLGVSLT
jgi:hypothetical protein